MLLDGDHSLMRTVDTCEHCAAAKTLMKQQKRITSTTTMVWGVEGALVQYAPNPSAVGVLPFPLMSAHTMSRISAAVAKVCSPEK